MVIGMKKCFSKQNNVYKYTDEELSEIMYDKQLVFVPEVKVAEVLYSYDKSKRYVILKNNNGTYTYIYERIIPLDEDEINLLCLQENFLPAYWCEDSDKHSSFYSTQQDAKNGIVEESNYKTYFKREADK